MRCAVAADDSSNGSQPPQEKFHDPRRLVQEAKEKSSNLVFEYDEEDDGDDPAGPVSLFEERMAAQAAAGAFGSAGGSSDGAGGGGGGNTITGQTVDVLSAYSSEQGFKEISVQEVAALRDGADNQTVLLDVRTPEEYANGHAVGAVNVPLDQVTTAVKAGQLPAADAPIAIICQSGRRSAQAAVKLTKVHGFTNVVNVQGGTLAWISAGLPTER